MKEDDYLLERIMIYHYLWGRGGRWRWDDGRRDDVMIERWEKDFSCAKIIGGKKNKTGHNPVEYY